MERTPSILSVSSYGSSSEARLRNGDSVLPVKEKTLQQQRIPHLKAVLGHCFYRRVVIWTLMSLALVTITIFHGRHVWVLDMVEYAKGSNIDLAVETTPIVPTPAYANENAPKDDPSTTALVEPVSKTPQESPIEPEDDEFGKEEEEEKEREEFKNEVKKKPWLQYPQ